MLEYAIIFVLTSTSKYAYIHYHRIYTGIHSYLLETILETSNDNIPGSSGGEWGVAEQRFSNVCHGKVKRELVSDVSLVLASHLLEQDH